jgi:hypothetical protein
VAGGESLQFALKRNGAPACSLAQADKVSKNSASVRVSSHRPWT